MMQLAYLPAEGNGATAHLIDALSGFGGLCHVELIFSNGDTLRASYGELVSLAPRDHDDRWVFEPIDATPGEEEIIRVWAGRELGSPYDTWGVARFVLPCLKQHPDAWFCSELCVAALQRVNRLLPYDPWRISPNVLRGLDKSPQYFLNLPPA